MRQRMSRSHKSRRGFKVDTILDKLIAKKKHEQNLGVRGYMTLTFLGFYDKKGKSRLCNLFFLYVSEKLWFKIVMFVAEISQDPVKVETLLLKICHKKRKDVSSPVMQVSLVSIRFKIYQFQILI